MDIFDIINKRRSIRRFCAKKIDDELLFKIVKTGTLYPSRANKQPLKFIIINNKEKCNDVFKAIQWGSKIEQYKVFSEPNYSPSTYILVLVDTTISKTGYEYELGAAVENILLSASANDIGSVWIKSIDTNKIAEIVNLEETNILIDSLIGLGYSEQISQVVDMVNENYHTIVDEDCNIKVPKRNANKIIYLNEYKKR